MIVVAFDTSDRVGSIALAVGAAAPSLAVLSPDAGPHGPRLLAEIHRLLSEAGLSLQAVDVVATTNGPGSFTGLRVGLATAQALGFGLGCRVGGVGTLHAQAEALRREGIRGVVTTTLDASRGEVYAAAFELADESVHEHLPPAVLLPARWLERLHATFGRAVPAFGAGAMAHPDAFSEARPAPPLAPALCAMVRDSPMSLSAAGPIYVRPSEAEVKFGRAPAFDLRQAIDAGERTGLH